MALKVRDFLARVQQHALEVLREDPPQARLRGAMIQLFYGEFHQHYEVWLRRPAGLVELGLHFEGDREDNRRRLAVVAEAMPEVAGRLGPQVEIEEWTESWTRVHETVALRSLDEGFAEELGQRLAGYVEVLEPVVQPLGPIKAPDRREGTRRRPPRQSARAARG